MKSDTSIVPCNGCRKCCTGDVIVLHPELGDDIAKYKTVEIKHPFSGETAFMLDHKENGDCIYLGEHGCENYENRPTICRTYDCRKQFLSLTRAQKEMLTERGYFSEAQLNEGKKRQWSLTGSERMECIVMRNTRNTESALS